MKMQWIRLRRHSTSRFAALCALVAATGPAARFADAAPAGAPAVWRTDSLRPRDTWNTLTVQMSVSRQRVSPTGEPAGSPAPAATYRIERSSRTGSWKTVITVLGVDRAPVLSLAGALVPPAPFPVSRIEDDEDGTPVRVYDAAGRRLAMAPGLLSSAEAATPLLPRSSGRSWLEGFVASAAEKPRRLRDFERQFGKGTKAGALTRYVRKDLDSSEEVLVDSKTVVPVEVKGRRGRRLVSRRTFAYAPAPDGALVRASVRAEIRASADTGETAIVDTRFSDVRLELRR